MTTDGLIRKDGADGTSLFWARDVAAGLNDYAAVNGSLAATQRAYELGASAAMLEQIRKASVGLPQFAVGTNSVPHDMVAQLHAGEEVKSRPYVDIERDAREQTNALLARLVDSNAALTARMDSLTTAAQQTAAHTGNTAAHTQRHAELAEQVVFGDISYQTRASGTDV